MSKVELVLAICIGISGITIGTDTMIKASQLNVKQELKVK